LEEKRKLKELNEKIKNKKKWNSNVHGKIKEKNDDYTVQENKF
jgi:hypothetical protein